MVHKLIQALFPFIIFPANLEEEKEMDQEREKGEAERTHCIDRTHRRIGRAINLTMLVVSRNSIGLWNLVWREGQSIQHNVQ